MSVLYVTQPDAVLNKSYEAFTVALKQEDGSWKKEAVPAQTVEQVVLMGNPQITGDASPLPFKFWKVPGYCSSRLFPEWSTEVSPICSL